MFSKIVAIASAAFIGLTTFASANNLMVTGPGAPEGGVTFSMVELDALVQESFSTSTIWTDETVTFSGVPLSVLLEEAGAHGTSVSLIALNDYAASLQMDEIGPLYPLIATRLNGEEMSVREKGPFWVVYPYDSDSSYQSETIYSRSVWQLREVAVIE